MRNLEKYKGVIPAFYAYYDKEGKISPEGVQALTKYFIEKGVKGVYVNGSSGECIYQSVEDRKIVLENVMKAAEGKLTVIAHVACNNTKDSMELARKQFRNVLHMQKLTICCLMKKAVMK